MRQVESQVLDGDGDAKQVNVCKSEVTLFKEEFDWKCESDASDVAEHEHDDLPKQPLVLAASANVDQQEPVY